MIAPEKWYEYQKKYREYGFDMQPKYRVEKQEKVKPKVSNNIGLISNNGRKFLFMSVLAIGLIMIMAIIVTAYSANIRYDINTMIKENNALVGEIESLESQIYTINNINYIEGRAINELGMAYALPEQIQYIEPQKDVKSDFASILKEEAYN